MEEQEPIREREDVAEERHSTTVSEMLKTTRGGHLSSEDKVFAALSYVSIMFIIPLILRHDQDDVYFHARQGMVLFSAEVVIWFLLFMLESFVVALMPSNSLGLVAILGAVAWILFVGLSVIGIYFIFRNKRWEMPVLGKIAKKIEV
jgi:fumarate reductase subunit D